MCYHYYGRSVPNETKRNETKINSVKSKRILFRATDFFPYSILSNASVSRKCEYVALLEYENKILVVRMTFGHCAKDFFFSRSLRFVSILLDFTSFLHSTHNSCVRAHRQKYSSHLDVSMCVCVYATWMLRVCFVLYLLHSWLYRVYSGKCGPFFANPLIFVHFYCLQMAFVVICVWVFYFSLILRRPWLGLLCACLDIIYSTFFADILKILLNIFFLFLHLYDLICQTFQYERKWYSKDDTWMILTAKSFLFLCFFSSCSWTSLAKSGIEKPSPGTCFEEKKM